MTPNLEAQKVSRIDSAFQAENSKKDLNYIVTLQISKLLQPHTHTASFTHCYASVLTSHYN